MIVYQATKGQFLSDVREDSIEDIVRQEVHDKLKIRVGRNEFQSWQNSLREMFFILDSDSIPDDCGVAIEYRIPQTSKRLDFIIVGADATKKEQVLVVELKQWDKVGMTEKDAIITTRLQQGVIEREHPSYQAWSYATLLENFNKVVYTEGININPCAYLHNYERDGIIDNDFYSEHINNAPLFLKGEKQEFRSHIVKFIDSGDTQSTLTRLDASEIRPSPSLADSLSSMLKGNREFVMIDDQKLVYETALHLGRKSTQGEKQVLIVEGGPGTGKSVVAVNLLVELTRQGKVTKYVTKNAAPRTIYESMLTGDFKKSQVSTLFSGSGSFVNTKKDFYDALVVDEAHRLNAMSGMFKNYGENQIKEIIESSKLSVFFLDENQKVTWSDIGDKEAIVSWAEKLGATVSFQTLSSQFRCNGADGYLAWLDNVLDIRETANTELEEKEYDFKVFDSPVALRDAINEKNKERNKARLVAGYCWDWKSQKNKNAYDIEFPEYDLSMRWNLASDGNLWIVKPESVSEVGCIHTCQGLELDYVGVIVGLDFVVRDGKVVTVPSARARSDASLHGYKKQLAVDPIAAERKADLIIKNTYRTLMTRGMKGCYVYFVDKETEEYFRKSLESKPLTT